MAGASRLSPSSVRGRRSWRGCRGTPRSGRCPAMPDLLDLPPLCSITFGGSEDLGGLQELMLRLQKHGRNYIRGQDMQKSGAPYRQAISSRGVVHTGPRGEHILCKLCCVTTVEYVLVPTVVSAQHFERGEPVPEVSASSPRTSLRPAAGGSSPQCPVRVGRPRIRFAWSVRRKPHRRRFVRAVRAAGRGSARRRSQGHTR
jgi:hypothetical protein